MARSTGNSFGPVPTPEGPIVLSSGVGGGSNIKSSIDRVFSDGNNDPVGKSKKFESFGDGLMRYSDNKDTLRLSDTLSSKVELLESTQAYREPSTPLRTALDVATERANKLSANSNANASEINPPAEGAAQISASEVDTISSAVSPEAVRDQTTHSSRTSELGGLGIKIANGLIERTHIKNERGALREERRKSRVPFIAGLKEIGEATKGMSKTEKAKFGLDLTELQLDERHSIADKNTAAGTARIQNRMKERISRLGEEAAYAEADGEIALATWRQREAKMVADARAAEQSMRLNSKLTRAENRETRIQARADAKAGRKARREAWMNTAQEKAKKAAELTAKAAKGAGKIALATVSATAGFAAAGVKEVYDLSLDIAGGAKDAVKNATQKVGERASLAADNHHQRVGDRAIGKAERAAEKATKHHAKSSSEISSAEVVTK